MGMGKRGVQVAESVQDLNTVVTTTVMAEEVTGLKRIGFQYVKFEESSETGRASSCSYTDVDVLISYVSSYMCLCFEKGRM